VNKEEETCTFLSIGKTLTAVGWKIIKFEDFGGGVTLTIIPQEKDLKGNKGNTEDLDF